MILREVLVLNSKQIFLACGGEADNFVVAANKFRKLGQSVKHDVVKLINDRYLVLLTNLDQVSIGHCKAYFGVITPDNVLNEPSVSVEQLQVVVNTVKI